VVGSGHSAADVNTSGLRARLLLVSHIRLKIDSRRGSTIYLCAKGKNLESVFGIKLTQFLVWRRESAPRGNGVKHQRGGDHFKSTINFPVTLH